MATVDHTHPDHTCPRCRDDENSLRPGYVQPSRRPAEDEGQDTSQRWSERW